MLIMIELLMKIVKWLGIGDKFYVCSQQLWTTREGLHRCKERGNTRKRNEKQVEKNKKEWKSNAKVSSEHVRYFLIYPQQILHFLLLAFQ